MAGRVKRKIEDPWVSNQYRAVLRALYRTGHAKGSRNSIDDEEVRAFDAWLTPDMLQTLWSVMPDKHPNVASRSTVMTAVASAILHMRHGNTGDPEFNKWNTEAIRLRRQHDFMKGKSKAGPDYKTYLDFVSGREGYKKAYEKEGFIVDYWRWFLLALYTTQPPLRSEWGDMRVIRSESRAHAPHNYVVVPPSGECKIIINADKVAGTSAFKSKRQNTIAILPMGREKLKDFLASRTLPDVKAPMDSLRSAYATYVYNAPGVTFNEMRATAKSMRHDIITGLLHYRRAEGCGGGPKPIGGQTPLAPAPKPPAPDRSRAPAFDRQRWWQDYSERNAEQIKAKKDKYYLKNQAKIQQRSYLHELNSGTIRNPRKSTLKRLGIRVRKGVYMVSKKHEPFA
ncbi:FAD-dependent oxidoreductase [Micractinium conductrix]|uniref:FAD-dependent oxidoreductase n=1 Tax=Micractinium conductrix TaxID=554055 RepID=A0A2P6VCY4_9CHLO|nr:FAD-dependent oxidoreductase [Micractinium conductrix]|eukprot:PSC71944.1 FAD-dependent oxidoreductase [Micractinium conductrix]